MLETLPTKYLIRPLFNLIQTDLTNDDTSKVIDLLEGLGQLIRRYDVDELKEYKAALSKLLIQAIKHTDATIRLLGYRNLAILFGRFGTRLLENLKNQVDAEQARILQIYFERESNAN